MPDHTPTTQANSTNLQIFDFHGAEIRVVLIDDQPWWVATDVAKALGYGRTQEAVKGLDDDETKGVPIRHPLGGTQATTVVSESGMYSMVLRSRLPAAKKFRKWVTREVIPSIRRTGTYTHPAMVAAPLPTALELARQVVTALEQIEALTATAKVQGPKAEAWDVLAGPADDHGVAAAAKILARDHGIKIGQKRLFAALIRLGMAYRVKSAYHAYQEHVDRGRLVMRLGGSYVNKDGKVKAGAPTLRITAKGIAYLRCRLLAETETSMVL